jgi:cell division protein FtsB
LRGVLWIPIVLVAAAVHAALDAESGIPDWLRMRRELRVSEGRIEDLRAEIGSLRREVGALEGDPFAIEAAIREDLGLARPGETVVRWPALQARNSSISLTKSP